MQSLGAMRAIRQHHKDAHITLLTTKGMQGFAQGCGYSDAIEFDERPAWNDWRSWLRIRRWLNDRDFSRIYDLQNNDRTWLYFHMLQSPKPEWVGANPKGAYYSKVARLKKVHAFDRQIDMLSLAGIPPFVVDPLDWMDEPVDNFALKDRFVLMAPGCAPQHLHKRWPVGYYMQLARWFVDHDIQPVLLGTLAEVDVTSKIAQSCPEALNLTSVTSLPQIVRMARKAIMAVGNDTGPMHLIAATGCASLSLFSGRTDPVRHGPKGDRVSIIQHDNLDDLDVVTVIAKVETMMKEARA